MNARVCLIALVATCSLVVVGSGRRLAAQDGFLEARQLIVEGKYKAGQLALSDYLERQPRARHASRAGLFLFKACVAQGKTKEARQWCEWTIREHPGSLEAHKCRYKLAVLTLWDGQFDNAKQQFAKLADHPDGPLAAEAGAMQEFLEAYRCVPAAK